MSIVAGEAIDHIQVAIREMKIRGGAVNRISMTPAMRRVLIKYVGGAEDSGLVIDGAYVTADYASPPDQIYLTWWEA